METVFKIVDVGEGKEQQLTYTSLVLRLLTHAEADVRAATQQALHASLEGVAPRYVALIVLSWIQDCVVAITNWDDSRQTLVSHPSCTSFIMGTCAGEPAMSFAFFGK